MAAVALPSFATEAIHFDLPLTGNKDEAYWALVKKQFAVPENLVMCNAANLCPAPYMVNDQVQAFHQGLSRDVSFQYRAQFSDIRKKSLAALAEFMGATPVEIGITRNTSESNCMLVNGLDFKAGDEIILWDQNHPSNKESWISRAKRFGWIVKIVSVPANPGSPNDLIDPFTKAITGKTRLISFSHISNVSGIALPAKDICALAKSKGILTLIDGAQSLGYLDLNLRDIGCDFYTSSTHKWLMGPLENGILYINQSHLDKVWPHVIGGGWQDGGKTVDDKLCFLGQRNETTPAALPHVVRFHHTIGKAAIESRVNELVGYLKEKCGSIPGLTFITPMNHRQSGGVLVIQLAGKDHREVAPLLYSKYGIAGASTIGVRFSPHVYNMLADMDIIADALRDVARS